MKPNQFLDPLLPRIGKLAGELLATAEFAKTARELGAMMKEHTAEAAMPGFSHIRTALFRAMRDEGVGLPDGKKFKTDSYDSFTRDESVDSDVVEVPFEYVSRLYCITGSKRESDGKLLKALSSLLDEETQNNNLIFVHTVTPKDAQDVFDLQTITFAAVQVSGGKTHWFHIEPNDNKGGIIPVEAVQTELGDTRNAYGPVDYCPIKAVPVKAEDCATLRDELHAVKRMIEEKRPKKTPSRLKRLRDRLGNNAVSNRVLSQSKSAVTSSEVSS
jgi:hypothetical protein